MPRLKGNMRRTTLVFSLLGLLVLSRARAEPDADFDDALPPPSEPGSHAEYADALRSAEAVAYERLLDRYDAQLAATPRSVQTAVERCHFVELSISETEEEERDEERLVMLEQCLEQLALDFPAEPRAVLFRVEHSYGEERTALASEALADPSMLFANDERARLHVLLAEQLEQQSELGKAAEQARQASALDPQVDVALILARHEQSLGNKPQAIRALTRNLDRSDPDVLLQKARVLVDLQAFGPALSALDRFEQSDPDHYRDSALRARILEGLGRFKEARVEYAKQSSSLLGRPELQRRFELELRDGSAAQATAAYKALRDSGFSADPLLRQRLRLFWAHPTAPLELRDLLGLLTALCVVAAAMLVPGLLLVPVHYRGLVLRERNLHAPAPSPTGLRSAARLFGLLLACDLFASFVLLPELTNGWFDLPEVTPEKATLALLCVTHSAIATALTGLYFARHELGQLLTMQESTLQTLRRIGRSLRLTVLVAMANGVAVRLLGLDAQLTSGDVSTREMLAAVQATYGVGALLVIAVLCAPFIEELMFRYGLFDALERHVPGKLANTLQALFFTLSHDAWQMWPSLFTIGWLCGRMRRQSGSLAASMLFHGAWNMGAVLVLTLTR